MTRRRDLMLEDLRDCDHSAEIPVAEGGEILYWLCRCGQKKHYPPDKKNECEVCAPNPCDPENHGGV